MSNKRLLSTLTLGLFAFAFLAISCNNSGPDGPNLEITEVSPEQGAIGTNVTIYGSGFVPKASDNTVTFNGTAAEVVNVNADSILVKVPVGATNGPIELEIDDKTVTGPSFIITSEGEEPAISSIDPTEGPAGTEVTITGCNFSPNLSDNSVTFNGTSAEIKSVSGISKSKSEQAAPDSSGSQNKGSQNKSKVSSDSLSSNPKELNTTSCGNELVVVVPDEATTGHIEITVDDITITGPEFTVTDGDGNDNGDGDDGDGDDGGDNGDGDDGDDNGDGDDGGDNGDGDDGGDNGDGDDGGDNGDGDDGGDNGDGDDGGDNGDGDDGGDNGDGDDGGDNGDGDDGNGQAPSIDDINPTAGTVGTEVTITGENFGPAPADNTVEFGNTEATVTNASETELTAEVPGSLGGGDVVTVSVTVEGQIVEGPEFTVLTEGEPAFPITGSNASIEYGDRGGCGGCGITNPDNIIDGNTDNFGQVELSLGIAGSYFVRVESAGNIPAGGEAGFVMVNQGNLIGADLLNEITLTTFLDGTEQESVSGTDLLNLELVSGSTEKQFISFVTNSEFDEIEIDVGGLASLSATYEVYAAYGGREAEAVPGPAINSVTPDRGPEGTEVTITGQNFSATNGDNTVTFDGVQATVSSASETELVVEVPAGATTGPLNVLVSGQTATYEDFVVGAIPLSGSSLSVESESTLTCLGCNIDNDSNIIDEDRDNFASVTIPVSVAGTASITVSNTETMTAGGQAGFILSRSGGTLDAGLLENITIETFLNGNSQETIPSTGLLLLDLLSGSGTERQFVGVDGVTTKDFDTIEIRFTQVVGADITYEVYGVFDDYFVTD